MTDRSSRSSITVVAPLEGYYNTNGGVKVSMKRNIHVEF
jgi:hypothetical protein